MLENKSQPTFHEELEMAWSTSPNEEKVVQGVGGLQRGKCSFKRLPEGGFIVRYEDSHNATVYQRMKRAAVLKLVNDNQVVARAERDAAQRALDANQVIIDELSRPGRK